MQRTEENGKRGFVEMIQARKKTKAYIDRYEGERCRGQKQMEKDDYMASPNGNSQKKNKSVRAMSAEDVSIDIYG